MVAWMKRFAAPVAAFAVCVALPAMKVAAAPLLSGGALVAPPAGALPVGAPTASIAGNYTIGNVMSPAGTGTYNVSVWSPDSGTGFTTIAFNVHVNSGDVNRITLTNFGSFTTDVQVVGAGTNALFADRLSDGGSTVGFQFNQAIPTIINGLQAGDSTVTFVIRTNATIYTGGSINLIDGGVDSELSFAPASAPLPGVATAGMGLIGLVGGGSLLRRRRA